MRSFRNNIAHEEAHGTSLPLAPMADIFIVILILVLKTISFDAPGSGTDQYIDLPLAQAPQLDQSSVQIQVSKDGVSINREPAAALTGYEFSPAELNAEGNSPALGAALSRFQAKGASAGPQLTLYADKGAPYETVRTILSTAMSLGMTHIQIAVAQE